MICGLSWCYTGKIGVVLWFEQYSGVLLQSGKDWCLLIITQTHALHKPNSIFAGKLMFMEPEINYLKTLSNVNHPSWYELHGFHCLVE